MGEVGKSPHVQSRQQALAIAYAKERGRLRGGDVTLTRDPAGLGDYDVPTQEYPPNPSAVPGTDTYEEEKAAYDTHKRIREENRRSRYYAEGGPIDGPKDDRPKTYDEAMVQAQRQFGNPLVESLGRLTSPAPSILRYGHPQAAKRAVGGGSEIIEH